jgi:predicted nucleic acid-binding protein
VGSITLPPGGSIYLDANALIYSVETHPTYWLLLDPVWRGARAGRNQFVVSELVLLEVLVMPLRNGDTILVNGYERVLATPEFTVHAVNNPVLRRAAELRAAIPGLRTPDAIHVATALLNPPYTFLTNDPGFRRVPGLPVTVLSDLLTP